MAKKPRLRSLAGGRPKASPRPRKPRAPDALQDFVDVVASLNAARARFLVVGAYAMAAHGVPRATGDLDVWVDPTEENGPRVFAALARFGAPLQALGITLIRNKEAAGRAKDLADLELLRRRGGEKSGRSAR